MLNGSMQIQVLENEKTKFSKTIDENDFFGYREGLGQLRNDFCTAVKNDCQVVQFDSTIYKKLITDTKMSQGEMKIDFLMRYGPQLRKAGRRMIEQYEVFFIKERVTKGY
jgi:hypothetical protein